MLTLKEFQLTKINSLVNEESNRNKSSYSTKKWGKRLRFLHEIAIFIHYGWIPFFSSCDIVLPRVHIIFLTTFPTLFIAWDELSKGRRFAFVLEKDASCICIF